jgi:hypothetical protein
MPREGAGRCGWKERIYGKPEPLASRGELRGSFEDPVVVGLAVGIQEDEADPFFEIVVPPRPGDGTF